MHVIPNVEHVMYVASCDPTYNKKLWYQWYILWPANMKESIISIGDRDRVDGYDVFLFENLKQEIYLLVLTDILRYISRSLLMSEFISR